MDEIRCPQCARADGQLKIGRNESGSQRYVCKTCRRKYTPEPNPIGYADDVRQQANRLYVDGVNFRRIGRLLGVSHQTVANWVAAHARTLPDEPPVPPHAARTPLVVGELDELYTFEGEKKTAST
jgi:transposase